MKVLIILASFFVFNVQAQTVEPYVNSIKKARIEVESNIEQTPYQKIQQEVFKTYFSDMGEFINDMKESDRLVRRFQNYFSSNGVANSCKELFLDKSSWNELVKKCTKNRFFLCAEEVRAFSAYKEALKENLTPEMKEEFSKEALCEI